MAWIGRSRSSPPRHSLLHESRFALGLAESHAHFAQSLALIHTEKSRCRTQSTRVETWELAYWIFPLQELETVVSYYAASPSIVSVGNLHRKKLRNSADSNRGFL